MEKYAVIDLGTNTFHILIAEKIGEGRFSEIYRERQYIKLAEQGIQTIGNAPYLRGVNALLHFKKILDQFGVSHLRVSGTAALRTASNGAAFINEIKSKTGISIQLISGDEEAFLIYKGVVQAVPLGNTPSLIMDIGGGSVEFIIADRQNLYWKKSFPVGVAVLFKNFHRSDPISKAEIEQIYTFLEKELKELISVLPNYNPHYLIGASGTFDVLESNLGQKSALGNYTQIHQPAFQSLYHSVLESTFAQRLDMPNIPDNRADMIVVAFMLIQFILQRSTVHEILISNYAMKEGMLYEMMYE